MAVIMTRLFSVLAILCAISMFPAWSLNQNQVDMIQKVYRFRCDGHYADANDLVKKLGKAYPDQDFNSFLNAFVDENRQDVTMRILATKAPTAATDSKADRIRYASAMVRARSSDIDLMDKLLSFSSKDELLESRRVFLSSMVDFLRKNYGAQRATMLKAIGESPIASPNLLGFVFYMPGGRKENEELIKTIGSGLKMKVNKSMNPHFADAVIKYSSLETSERKKLRLGILGASYKDCPRDPTIASLFAGDLVRRNENQRANRILERLVLHRKFPKAIDEFNYGVVRYRLGDKNMARLMFDKVLDPNNLYIRDSSKRIAYGYLASMDAPMFSARNIIMLGLFGCLILLWIVAKVMRAKST